MTVADIPEETKESAVELAERHLQCGPHELAWVRDQQGRYYFATRDPDDCEFYPSGHELSGKSRYFWVGIEDNVEIGWLNGA